MAKQKNFKPEEIITVPRVRGHGECHLAISIQSRGIGQRYPWVGGYRNPCVVGESGHLMLARSSGVAKRKGGFGVIVVSHTLPICVTVRPCLQC